MSLAARIAGGIDRVVDAAGLLAAACCCALVVVMATNVLLRYLFSTGSVWAQELEWHLLVPICLLGMAYAIRHGEHVRVDIFFATYPERLKVAIELFAAMLGILFGLVVIILSWRYVGQSWRIDEGSANPGGIPWRWALKAFIPLGFAIFTLQSLGDALRAAERLRA
ncbi:TRAP transporter small permease subunit [Phreatobacter sp.]|uniref:TRAP transporter small permease subunit n=1 Tax=Phreatobacter sp. TaxID=1966341 RepID=UPI0025E3E23B|nr:TRAP transporter small permease subunit [Phreatobacter sp.]